MEDRGEFDRREDGDEGALIKPEAKGGIEAEERETDDKYRTLVQTGTLCATVIALFCEIMVLIEVIVRNRVPYSLFAVSFSVIGVFATVAFVHKISTSRKTLICGIICLALALAFAVLWILSLCSVIK